MSQLGFPVLSWYGADALSLEILAPLETLTTYSSPRRLAERSCELKLKLAHLFWQLGLPARLFKPVAQTLVGDMLMKVGQAHVRDWPAITQAIDRLDATVLWDAMGSQYGIPRPVKDDDFQE